MKFSLNVLDVTRQYVRRYGECSLVRHIEGEETSGSYSSLSEPEYKIIFIKSNTGNVFTNNRRWILMNKEKGWGRMKGICIYIYTYLYTIYIYITY